MKAEHLLLDGPAGKIEAIVERPAHLRGIALIAHPHPLGGGSNSNKVVHTLARALLGLGYECWRPNFRGVGQSEGTHDEGAGETADLLAVLAAAQRGQETLPVVLAGYSFGAYCQTRVLKELAARGQRVERVVLVGTAAGYVEGSRHYDTAAVPPDTLVIHGATDTLVPLANVLAWAEPLDLPVVVIPAADHFFHRRLHLIRDIVTRAWSAG